MPAPLLSTKFTLPRARPNLVPRDGLRRMLDEGLTRRLVLVSAPPGFGKTTLVAGWLAGSYQSYAWLSLDEGDNDPARFFTYLVAALEQVHPEIGLEFRPLLGSPQPPPLDALIAGLINDLALLPGESVIVLDDYHVIQVELIHKSLQFFTEHLPPQLHLVIISRQDPPLSLPRLRARGELLEIREADLRFSLEETSTFMKSSIHQALSPQALGRLHRRTEGWVAGLQMAALALRSPAPQPPELDAEAFIASFHGDDRFIMDYLMEEVFNHQSQPVQDFLLQTSILEKMCAPLCDAVLAEKGRWDVRKETPDSSPIPLSESQDTLEYLDRANLFTLPLDNRREWYRYHHLFADLLRFRLQRQSQDKIPELHRRASRWFASAGFPDEAMKHALSIPDPSLAASLAEQYMLQMVGRSQVATYLSWVRHLPDELIYRRAYLCAGCGWAYAIICETDAARKYVEAGEAALAVYEPVKSAPDLRLIRREEVHGHLSAIRAYTDRLLGDYPAAIVHSRQALESLPAEAGTVRSVVAFNLGLLQMETGELEDARKSFGQAIEASMGSQENLFVAVSARSLLGGVAAQQGRLREAEGSYRAAIELGTVGSGKPVPIPAVSYAHGGLAALYYLRNELAAAEEHLEKALPLVQWIGQPEPVAIGYIYRSLLAQARGDFSLAEEWLGKTGELLEAQSLREGLRIEFEVAWGQLLLAQGEVAAAAQRLERRGIQGEGLREAAKPAGLRVDQLNLQGSRLAEYLLLARLLLAQGAQERAGALLERVRAQAEAAQNVAVLVEALVLQALAVYRRPGDLPLALTYLGKALNLASAENFVRPFLNAGDPLVKLLRQAILQDIQPGYAQGLLAALEEQARRRAGAKRAVRGSRSVGAGEEIPSPSILLEPLTARERQVLRLLAAGLSSTEIAGELVLSVSTARSYIKSVYSKLGAHNREQAIEKGRAGGEL